MSADAAPEAVAERVAEWRNRRGRARDEQLDDACDLIEALAADRAAIPMTERDRRETSGESDPWAPWREAPTIGDMAMCGACGKPIRYIGPYWQHTTYTPRHIATPAQEPRP